MDVPGLVTQHYGVGGRASTILEALRGLDALSPAVVFGHEFVQRIRANVKATDDGLLAAVLVVARA